MSKTLTEATIVAAVVAAGALAYVLSLPWVQIAITHS
jgi:hypothetical protein